MCGRQMWNIEFCMDLVNEEYRGLNRLGENDGRVFTFSYEPDGGMDLEIWDT